VERKDGTLLIVVDPHSGVPVYRQIMDQIKFHVASGLLKPGDELPSTRALSSELGMNPMTISKAYSYLERDGLVVRRPGRQLVVGESEDTQIRRRKMDQLKKSLAPVITTVRQLGFSKEEVLEVLAEMLDSQKGSPQDRREEDTE
jgi:GntR family transcriptional regulator